VTSLRQSGTQPPHLSAFVVVRRKQAFWNHRLSEEEIFIGGILIFKHTKKAVLFVPVQGQRLQISVNFAVQFEQIILARVNIKF
jgi:predicted ester cyclase